MEFVSENLKLIFLQIPNYCGHKGRELASLEHHKLAKRNVFFYFCTKCSSR